MDYGTIIQIIIISIVLAVAIVRTVKAAIQLSKDKTLYPQILQYITEAEEEGTKAGWTGSQKLDYVVSKIETYAAGQGLKLDITYVKDLIGRIIDVTKNVNVRGKRQC